MFFLGLAALFEFSTCNHTNCGYQQIFRIKNRQKNQSLEVLGLRSFTLKFSETNSVYCSLNAPLATLQICEKTTPPPNFKPQTDDLLMLQNCTNLILTTRCKNDNKIFILCFFNSKCEKYQSILSNWWILHYL